MKKIASLIITLALILSSSYTAFASNSSRTSTTTRKTTTSTSTPKTTTTTSRPVVTGTAPLSRPYYPNTNSSNSENSNSSQETNDSSSAVDEDYDWVMEYLNENAVLDDSQNAVVADQTIIDFTTKGMYTISTKQGSVFYLIIDSETHEAFFLNKVDNADLYALTSEGRDEKVVNKNADLTQKLLESSSSDNIAEEASKKTKSNGLLVPIIILIVAIAAAIIIIKKRNGSLKKPFGNKNIIDDDFDDDDEDEEY